MALFDIPVVAVDECQQLAIGILQFGQQSSDEIIRLYRMQREMLWRRDKKTDGTQFTLADAQETIDKMGPSGLLAFQKHGALRDFIHTTYPGVLTEAELTPPVAYTIVDGRIVLDPNGAYPGPQHAQAN